MTKFSPIFEEHRVYNGIQVGFDVVRRIELRERVGVGGRGWVDGG